MAPARDPFADPPPGLRTRAGAGGRLRVWWEPTAAQRAAGMAPVTLDEARPTWSRRRAADLTREAERTGRNARRPDARRTLQSLADAYMASAAFRVDLAPRTRGDYRRLIARVTDRLGHRLAADVDKPVLHAWHEELRAAHGARTVQALIRMASILFSHAELIGWRAENTNPAFRMKIRQPKPRDRVGTWEELDALVRAADARGEWGVALAVLLSALNGQRQGDVLALRADQLHRVAGMGGEVLAWSLLRSKRQTAGVMPVHQETAPRLRLAIAAATDPAAPLLRAASGAKLTTSAFGDIWRAVRDDAARDCPSILSPVLQFRDLRRTFGALARSGGTSKEDIATVLGNTADTNFQLGITYMPPEYHDAARAVAGVRRKP